MAMKKEAWRRQRFLMERHVEVYRTMEIFTGGSRLQGAAKGRNKILENFNLFFNKEVCEIQ
jgi:hypothetical protein